MIICTRCGAIYHFKKKMKTNYVCRICKIKEKTQSKEFREARRKQSKSKLANPDIKQKMSLIAQLNNVNNSEKISKSLKEYYSSPEAIFKSSEVIKEKWKDNEYRKAVSEGIKNKWKNDHYRNSVIISNSKKATNKRFTNYSHEEAKNQLIIHNVQFEEYYYIGTHCFNFKINNILLDLEPSQDKEEFINHYFANIQYLKTVEAAIMAASTV